MCYNWRSGQEYRISEGREASVKRGAWLAYSGGALAMAILHLLSYVPISSFLAVFFVGSVVFILFMVGPETVSEVKIFEAELKRDVQAAKEIRHEIEEVQANLREVAKGLIEYINIKSYSREDVLVVGNPSPESLKHLEHAQNNLMEFAIPDSAERKKWFAELDRFLTDQSGG